MRQRRNEETWHGRYDSPPRRRDVVEKRAAGSTGGQRIDRGAPGGEVVRRQTGAYQSTDDAARRGTDDDVCAVRIPSEIVLKGEQHTCVEGGTRHATCTEDEANTSTMHVYSLLQTQLDCKSGVK